MRTTVPLKTLIIYFLFTVAAASQASPNGQPFLAVNAEVDELKQQVADQQAAISAMSQQLVNLQGQVLQLQATIEQVGILDLTAILNELQALEERMAALDTPRDGAHLAGRNFDGADLSGQFIGGGANLDGIILHNANLTNAEFGNASMRAADLNGTTVDGAGFAVVDLYGASANFVDFSNVADLIGANMEWFVGEGANFSGVNLRGNVIRHAFLPNANFANADLSNTDLQHANLSGANIDGANLTGANLFNANTGVGSAIDAQWGNTICPDGSNSNEEDGDGQTCFHNGVWINPGE